MVCSVYRTRITWGASVTKSGTIAPAEFDLSHDESGCVGQTSGELPAEQYGRVC